jgi:multiple sugar transport system permease protein
MTMTNVVGQTWTPLLTIYRDAFLTDNLPLAAAASVVLALATVAASAAVLLISNRRRRRS